MQTVRRPDGSYVAVPDELMASGDPAAISSFLGQRGAEVLTPGDAGSIEAAADAQRAREAEVARDTSWGSVLGSMIRSGDLPIGEGPWNQVLQSGIQAAEYVAGQMQPGPAKTTVETLVDIAKIVTPDYKEGVLQGARAFAGYLGNKSAGADALAQPLASLGLFDQSTIEAPYRFFSDVQRGIDSVGPESLREAFGGDKSLAERFLDPLTLLSRFYVENAPTAMETAATMGLASLPSIAAKAPWLAGLAGQLPTFFGELGDIYSSSIDEGRGGMKALAPAIAGAAINTQLERLPIGRLLDRITGLGNGASGSLAREILRAAPEQLIGEAITEAGQEFTNILAENVGGALNPTKVGSSDFWNRIGTAAFGALGPGAVQTVIGGVGSHANARQLPPVLPGQGSPNQGGGTPPILGGTIPPAIAGVGPGAGATVATPGASGPNIGTAGASPAQAAPSPQTVTVGIPVSPTAPPQPDSPAAVQEQIRFALDPNSERAVVLFTRGTAVPADEDGNPPAGLEEVLTPHGLAWFNPKKITRREVIAAGNRPNFNPKTLFGRRAPATPAAGRGVVAVDTASAKNVGAEVVDTTKPADVVDAAVGMAAAHPGGDVSMKTVEQVASERAAATPAPATPSAAPQPVATQPAAPQPAAPQPAAPQPAAPQSATPSVSASQAAPVAAPQNSTTSAAGTSSVGLTPINYVDSPFYDKATGRSGRESGSVEVVEMAGRKMVMVNVNGKAIPFYLSTGLGGKAKVPPGHWYPFLGIDPNEGWINKGSESEILDFYGSQELRDVAQKLDAQLGANVSAKKVSAKSIAASINRTLTELGLTPVENGTSGARRHMNDNIAAIVAAIKGAPASSASSTTTPASSAPAAPAATETASEPTATLTGRSGRNNAKGGENRGQTQKGNQEGRNEEQVLTTAPQSPAEGAAATATAAAPQLTKEEQDAVRAELEAELGNQPAEKPSAKTGETTAKAESVPTTESAQASSVPESDVDQAIEVFRGEGSASVSLLQRKTKWGYSRAKAVVDEMQRRGVVGPERGVNSRTMNLPAAKSSRAEGVVVAQPEATTPAAATPTSEPKSKADELAKQEADANNLMEEGLANIADILSDVSGARRYIVQPDDSPKIVDALAKVFTGVIRLGVVKFKMAADRVMSIIRERFPQSAGEISAGHLRNAYNKAAAGVDGADTPEQVAATVMVLEKAAEKAAKTPASEEPKVLKDKPTRDWVEGEADRLLKAGLTNANTESGKRLLQQFHAAVGDKESMFSLYSRVRRGESLSAEDLVLDRGENAVWLRPPPGYVFNPKFGEWQLSSTVDESLVEDVDAARKMADERDERLEDDHRWQSEFGFAPFEYSLDRPFSGTYDRKTVTAELDKQVNLVSEESDRKDEKLKKHSKRFTEAHTAIKDLGKKLSTLTAAADQVRLLESRGASEEELSKARQAAKAAAISDPVALMLGNSWHLDGVAESLASRTKAHAESTEAKGPVLDPSDVEAIEVKLGTEEYPNGVGPSGFVFEVLNTERNLDVADALFEKNAAAMSSESWEGLSDEEKIEALSKFVSLTHLGGKLVTSRSHIAPMVKVGGKSIPASDVLVDHSRILRDAHDANARFWTVMDQREAIRSKDPKYTLGVNIGAVENTEAGYARAEKNIEEWLQTARAGNVTKEMRKRGMDDARITSIVLGNALREIRYRKASLEARQLLSNPDFKAWVRMNRLAHFADGVVVMGQPGNMDPKFRMLQHAIVSARMLEYEDPETARRAKDYPTVMPSTKEMDSFADALGQLAKNPDDAAAAAKVDALNPDQILWGKHRLITRRFEKFDQASVRNWRARRAKLDEIEAAITSGRKAGETLDAYNSRVEKLKSEMADLDDQYEKLVSARKNVAGIERYRGAIRNIRDLQAQLEKMHGEIAARSDKLQKRKAELKEKYPFTKKNEVFGRNPEEMAWLNESGDVELQKEKAKELARKISKAKDEAAAIRSKVLEWTTFVGITDEERNEQGLNFGTLPVTTTESVPDWGYVGTPIQALDKIEQELGLRGYSAVIRYDPIARDRAIIAKLPLPERVVAMYYRAGMRAAYLQGGSTLRGELKGAPIRIADLRSKIKEAEARLEELKAKNKKGDYPYPADLKSEIDTLNKQIEEDSVSLKKAEARLAHLERSIGVATAEEEEVAKAEINLLMAERPKASKERVVEIDKKVKELSRVMAGSTSRSDAAEIAAFEEKIEKAKARIAKEKAKKKPDQSIIRANENVISEVKESIANFSEPIGTNITLPRIARKAARRYITRALDAIITRYSGNSAARMLILDNAAHGMLSAERTLGLDRKSSKVIARNQERSAGVIGIMSELIRRRQPWLQPGTERIAFDMMISESMIYYAKRLSRNEEGSRGIPVPPVVSLLNGSHGFSEGITIKDLSDAIGGGGASATVAELTPTHRRIRDRAMELLVSQISGGEAKAVNANATAKYVMLRIPGVSSVILLPVTYRKQQTDDGPVLRIMAPKNVSVSSGKGATVLKAGLFAKLPALASSKSLSKATVIGVVTFAPGHAFVSANPMVLKRREAAELLHTGSAEAQEIADSASGNPETVATTAAEAARSKWRKTAYTEDVPDYSSEEPTGDSADDLRRAYDERAERALHEQRMLSEQALNRGGDDGESTVEVLNGLVQAEMSEPSRQISADQVSGLLLALSDHIIRHGFNSREAIAQMAFGTDMNLLGSIAALQEAIENLGNTEVVSKPRRLERGVDPRDVFVSDFLQALREAANEYRQSLLEKGVQPSELEPGTGTGGGDETRIGDHQAGLAQAIAARFGLSGRGAIATSLRRRKGGVIRYADDAQAEVTDAELREIAEALRENKGNFPRNVVWSETRGREVQAASEEMFNRILAKNNAPIMWVDKPAEGVRVVRLNTTQADLFVKAFDGSTVTKPTIPAWWEIDVSRDGVVEIRDHSFNQADKVGGRYEHAPTQFLTNGMIRRIEAREMASATPAIDRLQQMEQEAREEAARVRGEADKHYWSAAVERSRALDPVARNREMFPVDPNAETTPENQVVVPIRDQDVVKSWTQWDGEKTLKLNEQILNEKAQQQAEQERIREETNRRNLEAGARERAASEERERGYARTEEQLRRATGATPRSRRGVVAPLEEPGTTQMPGREYPLLTKQEASEGGAVYRRGNVVSRGVDTAVRRAEPKRESSLNPYLERYRNDPATRDDIRFSLNEDESAAGMDPAEVERRILDKTGWSQIPEGMTIVNDPGNRDVAGVTRKSTGEVIINAAGIRDDAHLEAVVHEEMIHRVEKQPQVAAARRALLDEAKKNPEISSKMSELYAGYENAASVEDEVVARLAIDIANKSTERMIGRFMAAVEDAVYRVPLLRDLAQAFRLPSAGLHARDLVRKALSAGDRSLVEGEQSVPFTQSDIRLSTSRRIRTKEELEEIVNKLQAAGGHTAAQVDSVIREARAQQHMVPEAYSSEVNRMKAIDKSAIENARDEDHRINLKAQRRAARELQHVLDLSELVAGEYGDIPGPLRAQAQDIDAMPARTPEEFDAKMRAMDRLLAAGEGVVAWHRFLSHKRHAFGERMMEKARELQREEQAFANRLTRGGPGDAATAAEVAEALTADLREWLEIEPQSQTQEGFSAPEREQRAAAATIERMFNAQETRDDLLVMLNQIATNQTYAADTQAILDNDALTLAQQRDALIDGPISRLLADRPEIAASAGTRRLMAPAPELGNRAPIRRWLSLASTLRTVRSSHLQREEAGALIQRVIDSRPSLGTSSGGVQTSNWLSHILAAIRAAGVEGAKNRASTAHIRRLRVSMDANALAMDLLQRMVADPQYVQQVGDAAQYGDHRFHDLWMEGESKTTETSIPGEEPVRGNQVIQANEIALRMPDGTTRSFRMGVSVDQDNRMRREMMAAADEIATWLSSVAAGTTTADPILVRTYRNMVLPKLAQAVSPMFALSGGQTWGTWLTGIFVAPKAKHAIASAAGSILEALTRDIGGQHARMLRSEMDGFNRIHATAKMLGDEWNAFMTKAWPPIAKQEGIGPKDHQKAQDYVDDVIDIIAAHNQDDADHGVSVGTRIFSPRTGRYRIVTAADLKFADQLKKWNDKVRTMVEGHGSRAVTPAEALNPVRVEIERGKEGQLGASSRLAVSMGRHTAARVVKRDVDLMIQRWVAAMNRARTGRAEPGPLDWEGSRSITERQFLSSDESGLPSDQEFFNHFVLGHVLEDSREYALRHGSPLRKAYNVVQNRMMQPDGPSPHNIEEVVDLVLGAATDEDLRAAIKRADRYDDRTPATPDPSTLEGFAETVAESIMPGPVDREQARRAVRELLVHEVQDAVRGVVERYGTIGSDRNVFLRTTTDEFNTARGALVAPGRLFNYLPATENQMFSKLAAAAQHYAGRLDASIRAVRNQIGQIIKEEEALQRSGRPMRFTEAAKREGKVFHSLADLRYFDEGLGHQQTFLKSMLEDDVAKNQSATRLLASYLGFNTALVLSPFFSSAAVVRDLISTSAFHLPVMMHGLGAGWMATMLRAPGNLARVTADLARMVADTKVGRILHGIVPGVAEMAATHAAMRAEQMALAMADQRMAMRDMHASSMDALAGDLAEAQGSGRVAYQVTKNRRRMDRFTRASMGARAYPEDALVKSATLGANQTLRMIRRNAYAALRQMEREGKLPTNPADWKLKPDDVLGHRVWIARDPAIVLRNIRDHTLSTRGLEAELLDWYRGLRRNVREETSTREPYAGAGSTSTTTTWEMASLDEAMRTPFSQEFTDAFVRSVVGQSTRPWAGALPTGRYAKGFIGSLVSAWTFLKGQPSVMRTTLARQMGRSSSPNALIRNGKVTLAASTALAAAIIGIILSAEVPDEMRKLMSGGGRTNVGIAEMLEHPELFRRWASDTALATNLLPDMMAYGLGMTTRQYDPMDMAGHVFGLAVLQDHIRAASMMASRRSIPDGIEYLLRRRIPNLNYVWTNMADEGDAQALYRAYRRLGEMENLRPPMAGGSLFSVQSKESALAREVANDIIAGRSRNAAARKGQLIGLLRRGGMSSAEARTRAEARIRAQMPMRRAFDATPTDREFAVIRRRMSPRELALARRERGVITVLRDR